MIDSPLLHRVLDVDQDAPPRRLVRAAQLSSRTFAQLVLSVLERDGFPLGTGSRDELRRARHRSATYADALRTLQEIAKVRVLKGPSLGRLYPPGLVRPVGDLDLIVPDEESLWRCLRALLERFPVANVDLSLVEGTRRHLFMSVAWPSDDPALDTDLSVEVYTAAFPGDSGSVEVRAEPPAVQLFADLLALAEERFQRPFMPKDVIDVILLSSQSEFVDPQLPIVVEDYRLAPEALELMEYTSAHAPVGPTVTALADRLRPGADRELRRRAAQPGPEPSPDVGDRLQSGQLLYGMALRRTPWHEAMRTAEVEHFGAGYFLRTPVGEYLLVTSGSVEPDLYEAAVAALDAP